jgi:ABC-type Mn2+/Zn2+ transport system ATPase subunit
VLWDREWAALSGGEAQRIVLAVALGMDTAEILLLDGEYTVTATMITSG